MVPAVKELWLTALRSGKYKQGLRRLKAAHNGEIKHCCLGVLCDIAVVVGVASASESAEDPSCGHAACSVPYPAKVYLYHAIPSGSGRGGLPPITVQEWAGLDESACERLARLNDGGTPFTDIANVIEREY